MTYVSKLLYKSLHYLKNCNNLRQIQINRFVDYEYWEGCLEATIQEQQPAGIYIELT